MDWERGELPWGRSLTRREALWHSAGALALVCSFDALKTTRRTGKRTAAWLQARASGPFEPFQADLPVAPVLKPVKRTKALEEYVVRMQPGVAKILPGYETPILSYEGVYPGPTIRARHGVGARVRQVNTLGSELNVHLHGGVQPASSDGHPMDGIAPGTERVYGYPNVQQAATLWYHDHTHGNTSRTLFAGLAGFYIVGDDEVERSLDLPRGEYDVPLMIADRAFNSDGSFRYRVDVDRGYRGDTILVNGAIAPRMRVERRLYRLRFLNASNARPYSLVLGNDREMLQIASDGGLLPRPVVRRAIPMEPAERVEVLIDFRRFAAGSQVILRNAIGEPTTTAVMRFDVVKGGREEAHVPKRMRRLEALPPVNAERTWQLSFHGLARPRWEISGLAFGMDRIDCRPRFSTTEKWTFVNNSNRTHPMHLHGYHFRVLSMNGKLPHPADRAWKDTVAVYPQQTVTVRPYFTGFGGRYVFHCHAAEHGDMSMMGQMEVVA